MNFVVDDNFFGDFKLGDNVQYNLEVLRGLYSAQAQAGDSGRFFRKPITILLASIAEALLYDLFWRMKHHTREGVPNVIDDVLVEERERTRDKFKTLIDGAKKHHLFADEGDGIYDRLDRLREVRNRIHIQNSNAKLERDELDVYTEERQKEAERAVEGVLRQMAIKHQRSTNAQGYVGELELPWEPYDPSGTM